MTPAGQPAPPRPISGRLAGPEHGRGTGCPATCPRWGRDAIALLEDGARLGPVFEVRLWRRALVGYRPEWNRMVLGDLDAFRSRRQHEPALALPARRRDRPGGAGSTAPAGPPLNPPSTAARSRSSFPERFAAARRGVACPPGCSTRWPGRPDLVRRLLADAFFGAGIPAGAPAVVPGAAGCAAARAAAAAARADPPDDTAALAAALADPDPATLAAAFAGLPNGVEEARVALAAGYDTTAHTLAFALWELADRPDLNDG